MPSSGTCYHRSPSSGLRFRCRRPAIVSIADSFASALVIAGFCREHSPRNKIASPSVRGLSSLRLKSVACCERLLPKKHAYFSKSPTRDICGRSVRVPRVYSTEAVPDMVNSNKESYQEESRSAKDSTVKDVKCHVSLFDEQTSHTGAREPWRHSAKGQPSSTAERKDTSLPEILKCRVYDPQSATSSKVDFVRQRHKLSYAEDEFEAISEFYSKAIGEKANWRNAVDVVMKDSHSARAPSHLAFHRDLSRDAIENSAIERFLTALFDERKTNQFVFSLYRELPSPGVSQLSKRSRGMLLRRFAKPPDRRWVDARRYLALVEDMNKAGFGMSRSLWTSAIHLAGHAIGRVFKSDLKRAIGLWHRMERFAGIKADSVVFNTLFDIAIKAGQYTVADRLVEEMKDRGIDFSRCGKVSKIFYSGTKKDVGGIRQAFDEFIKSGEIVDTVVLNCLLASFLRAGELETAEQLYDRMMDAQSDLEKQFPDGRPPVFYHPTLSSNFSVYRSRTKKLSRILKISASLKDRFPEQHEALQSALPLTPDTRTFHILLSHHAHQTGNLYQFMAVLRDMEKTYSVPPRAMVFLFLFEGFALHGQRSKQWTSDRLKDAWNSFRRALYDSKERFNDRYYFRRERLGWENPLAKNTEPRLEPIAGDIYVPLPSDGAKSIQHTGEQANSRSPGEEIDEEDGEEEAWDEDNDASEDGNIEDMLNNQSRSFASQHELENIEQRVENGIFLGRKIIIAILRAFGACCGPKDVLDVWLQIERIWQIKKRKSLDVLAVKEELERQLSRHKRV
jgi:pentatricopeptide repeat protein